MVVAEFDEQTSFYRFVLRPNYSLGWRGSLLLFWVIALYLALISLFFAIQGAWMVFPFAGAELLLLGTGLYLFAHRSFEREVVYIEGAAVRVERGKHEPQQREEFNRAWTRVVLQPSRIRWYPSRLLLRAHGKELEVGACLREEERRQLAQELETGIAAWQVQDGQTG